MMDLKMEVYTPSMELVGMLEMHNAVIWEEKAFTAGKFEIHSIITDETRSLLVPDSIIWIDGDTAGIIEHIYQQAGDDGPYITVDGPTLTGILNHRILWGLYDLKGTVPEIMRYLVEDCCINPTRGDIEARKIPHLVLADDQPNGGPVIQMQKTGGYLLELLEELGAAYNVAFGIRFNPELRRMEFWCRPGTDRSIHQTENNPVFYSTELDDVLQSEYTYNSSSYRNVAFVAGEGEGVDRIYITVDESGTPTPVPSTKTINVEVTGGNLSALLSALTLTVADVTITTTESSREETTVKTTGDEVTVKAVINSRLGAARIVTVNGDNIGHIQEIGEAVSTTLLATDGMTITIAFST